MGFPGVGAPEGGRVRDKGEREWGTKVGPTPAQAHAVLPKNQEEDPKPIRK